MLGTVVLGESKTVLSQPWLAMVEGEIASIGVALSLCASPSLMEFSLIKRAGCG
jgi:hypothetical protein